MKDSKKIDELIQAYYLKKALEAKGEKPKLYTCKIPEGAEIQPFRSEEQVRDEVLLKSKPVRIKDILTGEVTKFEGYKQCVDYMGINWVTFERMLQGRTQRYHSWELLK